LKADPHSLFIADLHLTEEAPAITARFAQFLTDTAAKAEALYILGDLFEAWIGDDDLDAPLHREVADGLSRLAESGVLVYLMHGNRDFLIGDRFCQASRARIVPENSQLDLYGTPTLLLHGDSLCTDDLAYQQLRQMTRNPTWQAGMLARPLGERRQLARQLRSESERAKDGKTMAIMDVNEQAVDEAFAHASCTRMIHGHTHRPRRHHYPAAARGATERWVLPDWNEERAGYLRCDATGCRLHNLDGSPMG